MKQKLLLFSVAAMFAVSSFAQLSQRTNDPSNFKFGTRPQAGDWGLNLQLYAAGGSNFTNYFQDVPIVNLQYYKDADLAFRFGIRASKHKTVFKGESNEDMYNPNGLSEIKYKSSAREYMVYVGAEKHFSMTNILDVYTGAQIPLGFSGNTIKNKISYTNGDEGKTITRSNSFIYGVECFVGLQAFIADLPIAVGAEWGLAGYGKLFDRTYNYSEYTGMDTQEYYTTNADASGTEYTKLHSRKFDMDNMVRFRISYYFSK
jgi:hypothetical protein